MEAPLIVAGHVCLDIIPTLPDAQARLSDLLPPGGMLQVGPVVLSTGGAVPNTGLALHRLGVPVRLMGKVADDGFGRVILDILRGYDPALADGMLVAPGEHSSYTVILSAPGLDRTFLHYPGPNDTFCAADVPDAGLDGARLFHFGYPPLMRRMYLDDGRELETLFRRVRARGLVTSLDLTRPDPDSEAGRVDWPALLARALPHVDVFLPSLEDLLTEVATLKAKGITEGLTEKQQMLDIVQGMHESNPMMGLRGIRLGIVYPDIMKMQVRAIFEAACDAKLNGFDPHPEVMIPLTGHVNELKEVQPTLVKIAKDVMAEKGVEVSYKFGTMIEIPRAAVTAGEIAEYAEFFSFGTNDLTQMTFGYSRDDAERTFLGVYVEKGILEKNPFQQLDREGVGLLMKKAVEDGRRVRPNLEVGICGEHGGDPSSIEWCHIIGNNYVSCSPFRVPLARLAAAQAALKHK